MLLRHVRGLKPPSAALGISVTAFVIMAIMFMRLQLRIAAIHGPIGFDESYAAAVGVRMVEGHWLPYVDAISHRGPMLYWMMAIATTIAGPYSWGGLRWLAFAACLASFSAIFVAGVAARRPLAGAAASAIYAYIIGSAFQYVDSVSVRSEQIAAPFTLFALVCLACGLERARSVRAENVWLLSAGVSTACAGLTKQTLLPYIGVVLLWPAAVAWSRRDTAPRERWLTALLPLLGWVIALVVAVTPYALVGELGRFWYWFWRYNAEIYMAPVSAEGVLNLLRYTFPFTFPWAALGTALLVSSALGAAVSTLSARRTRDVAASYARDGFSLTVGVGATVLVALAFLGARPWFHYFMVAVAWIALAMALTLERNLQVLGSRRYLAATLTTFTLLLLFVGTVIDRRTTQFSWDRGNGGWPDAKPDAICKVLDQYSRPMDPIFVWGFDADIYLTCRRRPASRFLFTTMVAGSVPGAGEDHREEWVAKGAPEMLKQDLVTARPSVVLDIPAFVGHRSITQVKGMEPWLGREYCRVEDVSGDKGRKAGVFLRRDNHAKACAGRPAP